ncbi:MAG TPA: MFS transporter, partial [Thermomicrobiales bacterium]|nr:MFS transporter [Thermomicrobiales bacterium]
PRMLVISASLFGASVLLASISPSLTIAVVALVIVGFFSINYTSLGNVTLQLNAAPEMQGRVMSLWTVAFLGSTPIGGPVIGFIGEHAGARWSLVVGGLAALIAAVIGVMAIHQQRRKEAISGPTRTLTGHQRIV